MFPRPSRGLHADFTPKTGDLSAGRLRKRSRAAEQMAGATQQSYGECMVRVPIRADSKEHLEARIADVALVLGPKAKLVCQSTSEMHVSAVQEPVHVAVLWFDAR